MPQQIKLRLIHFVIGLTFIFAIGRFIALDKSPPGFYVDEAAISAQVLCLKQTGADTSKTSWPLFSPVLGGGFATPTYLYPAVVWTSVFGESTASFRSLAAFFGIAFIAGCYFLGLSVWRTREAAWLVALAAATSPWSFQFSRIAWDPAISPALLAWSLFALFEMRARPMYFAAIGGFMTAAAAYSYPPLRVQLALVLPVAFALVIFRDRSRSVWQKLIVFIGSMLLFAIPLFQKTLSGELQGRFQFLSIMNPDYLATRGENSPGLIIRVFLENIGSHFSASYLLFTGDANLRHSTQAFGEWSWLNIFASFVFAAVVAHALIKRQWPSGFRFFVFCALGYLAGLVPAALTWESNPHALRSIGATVFLALFSGGAIALVWRQNRLIRITTVVIAVLFSGFFAHDYFTKYPERSALWFDVPRPADYPQLATQYFQLATGQRCQ